MILPNILFHKDQGMKSLGKVMVLLFVDRQIEKEDLAKYISRKREMFLVQYSLGVKREEIRKLEEIAKVLQNYYNIWYSKFNSTNF